MEPQEADAGSVPSQALLRCPLPGSQGMTDAGRKEAGRILGGRPGGQKGPSWYGEGSASRAEAPHPVPSGHREDPLWPEEGQRPTPG